MMQSNMSKKVWRPGLCCLLVLAMAIMGSVANAGESRIATAWIDPEGSVEVYVTIKDCTVYIEPTDDSTDLMYDTGALRFEESIERGTLMITISSIDGKRMGAEVAATLYLPRGAYEYVFLDVQNGETMVSNDVGSSFDITGDGADIGVQYPTGTTHQYHMRLTSSMCTFAINENATDYAIKAQVNGGSITVPMNDMPAYQATSGTVGEYNYSKGNGTASITADVGESSTLRFVSVRK